MRAEDVAAKSCVSRAWVHRLQQRRRETGSVAPRKQTKWRPPILTPDLPRLEALIAEQPDRTLAELRQALGTAVCLATLWRAIEGLTITVKNTPPRIRTGSGRRRRRPDRLAPPDPRD
jgi:transposase